MSEPLKVFVSHHHSPAEDAFTARLIADLSAAGIDVWIDTERIPSGDFVRKINEGLTGRQYLVLVMTPDSLKSSWVQMEVNAALHQLHNGRMLGVIPILAQACDERDIPPLWSTLQHYDATKEYSTCLTQLLRALGVQPKPVDPPQTSNLGGAKRDYYEVLGVMRAASGDEIKNAFQNLSRKYQPNANNDPGAEARLKEINEAYEVLGDTQKRQNYDRFGFGFGSFSSFNDLLEQLFANADKSTKSANASKGTDLKYDLTISFDEAIRGCQQVVEIPHWETCSTCNGNGAKPGTSTAKCLDCQGTGETRRVQQSIFGQFVNVQVCEHCRGEGRIITTPCESCHGQGRARNVRRITVNIPAGVDDGINLRVTGEGEVPRGGGIPGNLFVHLSVKPHAYFKREGNNILYELPISAADAAKGTTVDVPTMDGKERLWIPPGTQNGRIFRFEGKGAPLVKSDKRGDEIVTIAIKPWI